MGRRLTIARTGRASWMILFASWGVLGQELRAQGSDEPAITITGPAVIAFWRAPQSDSALVADPDLASALDQQQTYWSDTYGPLADLGITALTHAGRRFRERDERSDRLFEASPDSSDIGYLLVAPGGEFRVLYRLWFPDDLVRVARAHFGLGGHAPQRLRLVADDRTSDLVTVRTGVPRVIELSSQHAPCRLHLMFEMSGCFHDAGHRTGASPMIRQRSHG